MRSYASVLPTILKSSDNKKQPHTKKRLSFTVRCGQRSISCFVDYSLDNRETFFFRNRFNVFDFATLPVLTTAKTDVSRSLAVIITDCTCEINDGDEKLNTVKFTWKEIRRLYPGTAQRHFTPLLVLRRLEERQNTFLRRVPQDTRLLHLPGQRP